MLNFDLQIPTRLVFGRDTHQTIGQLIAPYAKKVLLHYGGASVIKSGLLDRVKASLGEAGVQFVELGGVVPNPRVSLAKKGVALCIKEQVELVLAVGGGSVLDSAKAIAVGVGNPQVDLWELYVHNLPINGALPVATILTLPATGSEMSNSTVLSNDETEQKCGTHSIYNRPLLSVVDPTLFETLPKNQIANGVCDMMSHITERYFSKTEHTELSDALCEATLRTLVTFGPKVYGDPSDYDSWCQTVLAGTMAHNDVLGVGRKTDWSCHKMEHELSALYDVPHGAGIAVVLPPWMRYVWKNCPRRFVDFATKVMGVEQQRDEERTVEAGICALEALFAGMHLPARLSDLGIPEDAIPLLAKRTVVNPDGTERKVGGIVRLYEEDIARILMSVK
jgi:alcohol dehydrogenase YqhD (iron-dependent ADH family)